MKVTTPLPLIFNEQGEPGYYLSQPICRLILKAIRDENNFSFNDIAQICGLDAEALEQFEAGELEIQEEALHQLLGSLNDYYGRRGQR